MAKNSNKNIHDFDFIFEYFSTVERQGPGSPEATIKALSFINNLNENSRIADLGCGSGGQTMVLAQNTLGNIVGLDIYPTFIEILNKNAKRLGLYNRVKGLVGSMDKLSFEKGSLDLIWSEGAIYNIGFKNGLKVWFDYLKAGGYIAVSEISWLSCSPPQEIYDFWSDNYSEMDTISNNIIKMQEVGYEVLATFVLPENCWMENFYIPCKKSQEIFLNKYSGDKKVEEFIANQCYEMELYQKYKNFYGYVFYIGKKNN